MCRWPAPAPNCPGLRAEAKLAWLYLYTLAGGIEKSCVVHAASIGQHQGTSERSGRRALLSLIETGLLQAPDRFKGEITVYLNDPLVVARARLVSAANSGQGELDFPDELSSPPEAENDPGGVLPLSPGAVPSRPPPPRAADLVSHPPADNAQDPPPEHMHKAFFARARNDALSIKSISEKNASSLRECENGGSDTRSAATSAAKFESREVARDWQRIRNEIEARKAREAPQEGQTLGGILGEVLRRLPTAAERSDQAERLAAWILARVADPALLRGPAQRIAWAVTEGNFPAAKLHALILRLDAMDRAGKVRSRGGYFIGAVKDEFKAHGLSWQGQPRGQPKGGPPR